jgi:hypothetical protein
MNSRDLSYAQLDVVKREINRSTSYLVRLRERMRQRGFAADDPLMRSADAAYFASVELLAALHKAQDHALKKG